MARDATPARDAQPRRHQGANPELCARAPNGPAPPLGTWSAARAQPPGTNYPPHHARRSCSCSARTAPFRTATCPAPQPSRSRPRWLRKERKNRKQNFLAADGHQLHILQMPPSKNKPAAAPPGRLTPGARLGPLPRDCPAGRIPHSGAPPGAPLPDTPPRATARSFALKLDPKWPGGQALSPSVPPCIPTSYHSRSSSWCLFQPCAPGFRAPLPQLLSPEVTLSPLWGVETPPDLRPPRPSPLGVHGSTRPPAHPPASPASQVPGRNFSPSAHDNRGNSPELFPGLKRAPADSHTALSRRPGSLCPAMPALHRGRLGPHRGVRPHPICKVLHSRLAPPPLLRYPAAPSVGVSDPQEQQPSPSPESRAGHSLAAEGDAPPCARVPALRAPCLPHGRSWVAAAARRLAGWLALSIARSLARSRLQAAAPGVGDCTRTGGEAGKHPGRAAELRGSGGRGGGSAESLTCTWGGFG
uniref:Uncharacterized protein n=1 Tax=Rangifer tarandus platyrhynchus TaxID=3082113 RepID=A0ACB0FM29_RANTA|nr:unnamed protein product [Rangifer tarandus platyrhynchus]